MAKKQSGKEEAKEIHLKVKLSPAEHKDVRVAAAELELTINDFLRQAVITYAEQTTAEYIQRVAAKTNRKPSRD